MNNLFSDIIADTKTIITNAVILLMLLFASAILVIYIGGVYVNPYVNDIPLVVLDEDNSSTSRSVINAFQNSDRFNVNHTANSKEELTETIESGKAMLGIYMPNDFEMDIKALRGSKVLIVTNGANVIIGNNAYAAAAEVIQTISAGVQIKLIEAKGLQPDTAYNVAMAFRFNDRILYDSKMTYMNYLIIGFITIFFQQLMLSAIGQVIIMRGKELAQRHTVVRLISIYIISFVMMCLSLVTTFAIAHFAFKVPLNGNFGVVFLMFLIFGIAINSMAIFISSIFRDKLKYSQFCYMLSLPTFITCGYVWPLDQIPQPLVFIIKLFWPLIYFSRNLDEYLIKGSPPFNFNQDMLNLIIFSVVWSIIGVAMFKWRFKKMPD